MYIGASQRLKTSKSWLDSECIYHFDNEINCREDTRQKGKGVWASQGGELWEVSM